MKITFVIPVYNERETLAALTEGILEHAAEHECRVLFVDDGSTDGSGDEMNALAQRYASVEILRLRGNFGKSAALAAGFAHAGGGDVVFTMDSDLQDDPKEIPRFLEKLDEGYDMVGGWKVKRHDPWHKTFPSRIYNRFTSWVFGLPLHDINCGFKAFRTDVVKHLRLYGEMHRLLPVMAHSMNYRVGEIPVEHHPRRYGQSKYGFERFSRGALDVLTMWFLSRYRHQPGHFFGKLGCLQALLGLVSLVCSLAIALVLSPGPLFGALLAAGMVLCATGVMTVSMGLLAEMVLRHFIRIDPAVYVEEESRGADTP
ncbi:MAG: glycosyltransferase family 2 protein [bacterium]|nr:glycosyltransferase family 2 protein [bacterium]